MLNGVPCTLKVHCLRTNRTGRLHHTTVEHTHAQGETLFLRRSRVQLEWTLESCTVTACTLPIHPCVARFRSAAM